MDGRYRQICRWRHLETDRDRGRHKRPTMTDIYEDQRVKETDLYKA